MWDDLILEDYGKGDKVIFYRKSWGEVGVILSRDNEEFEAVIRISQLGRVIDSLTEVKEEVSQGKFSPILPPKQKER